MSMSIEQHEDADQQAAAGSLSDVTGTVQEDGVAGSGAAVVALRLLKKGEWSVLSDVATLSLGKTGLLHLKTRVFRDGKKVAAMRIERLSNWPHHMYVQLIQRATLGNAKTSCIGLEDASIAEDAGALTWQDGRFHLSRVGEATEVVVDGTTLAANEPTALADGTRIDIGAVSFTYKAATDDDFVGT